VPPVRRLRAALILSLMCAGAIGRGQAPPQSGAPAAVPAPAPPGQLLPFDQWLAALRAEALTRGVSQRTVDEALGAVERQDVVVERDRTQPELVLSLDAYLTRRLTPRLVRDAKAAARDHRALLQKAARAYGVPAPVIVAIWALESNIGRFTGTRPTIAALATLAYDTRRPAMFREELFAALQILDSGEIAASALNGSWAGAMGQAQFMPSSYLKYAVDFDGDRRRDIWTSTPDVVASIGNYLKSYGWVAGVRWGREVRIPDAAAETAAADVPLRMTGSCAALRELSEPRPLRAWAARRVRLKDGSVLPVSDLPASLVRVDTRRFLVYANYEVLLGYNCAHTYALSVALLAERIGGAW
jgi:membrane-bound lytic murein transglycosylase B